MQQTLRINVENEQIVLSYLMRNPGESITLKDEYFLNPKSRAVYTGIRLLHDKELKFDYDTVVTLARDNSSIPIEFTDVSRIFEAYQSFDNIEFNKKELKSDWVKFSKTSKILEDVLTKTTARGYISPHDIDELGNELKRTAALIDDSSDVVDTKELVATHRADLLLRGTEDKIRTTGISELDRVVTPPLAEGCIYICFGEKGSGKSVFVKNIENSLINKGTCVVSFNPEMPLLSIMDRIVCLRGNFTKKQLHEVIGDRRVMARIENVWREFSEIPNYLYSAEPHFDFNFLELQIERSRNIFKARGVLPKDGYMVCTVDLLSMAKNFKEKSASDIENGMDELHEVARRTNVSILGVVQSNENKFRSGKWIKKPEDLEYYRIGLEDLKGSAAYAERARVVISLYRPLFLKHRFFPEMKHIWSLEPDLMHVNILKNNDGELGFTKMLFQGENFRVMPYVEDDSIQENRL